MVLVNLTLNKIVIESRASDKFINATQLCKAGGKEFKHWFSLNSTKKLIKVLDKQLNLNVEITTFKKPLIDITKGRYGGTWIHPDLAVQLAQWISPEFSIQVSRWIRELFITGSVSLDSRKTDEELKVLQDQLREKDRQLEEKDNQLEESKKQLEEKNQQITNLEAKQLKLKSYVRNIKKLEKEQIFYIATTPNYAQQSRFEYGGVSTAKDLKGRLATYNTGRAEGDLYYYTKLFKCNSYKLIEERIGSILQQFKDKEGGRKEMIHLRYNLLIEVADIICENYDREIEYINSRCQTFLNESIELNPIIPKPIDLSNYIQVIVSKNGKITKSKKINVSDWKDEQVDDLIKTIIEKCANEKKKIEYKFSEQKDSVALELAWSLLTPYLDLYNGLTKTEWRSRFKDWLGKEKPKRLVIKGIKLPE